VFNWPGDTIYPSDLRTNYIKRCVATAGDVLEIRNRQVYINGKPQANPPDLQYMYSFSSTDPLESSYLKKLGIANYDDATKSSLHDPIQHFQNPNSGLYDYTLHMSPKVADLLKKEDFIRNLSIFSPTAEHGNMVYAYDSIHNRNQDAYGPLTIPKKGMKIQLTPENIHHYYLVIRSYEDNEKVELVNGKVLIDGNPVSEYTFKQNYYWMMGDNRHNSLDSRFWGFVPEDHVVGKAWFIWLSIDPDNRFTLDGIRWKRLFSLID
jgi:signal peptidase I